MPDIPEICPNCGRRRKDDEPPAPVSAFYDFRCPDCGFEEAGTANFTAEALDIQVDESEVEVIVEWRSGTPSAIELKVMRELVPELSAGRVTEAKAKLGSSAIWNLGLYPTERGKELAQILATKGLKVTFRKAEPPNTAANPDLPSASRLP